MALKLKTRKLFHGLKTAKHFPLHGTNGKGLTSMSDKAHKTKWSAERNVLAAYMKKRRSTAGGRKRLASSMKATGGGYPRAIPKK